MVLTYVKYGAIVLLLGLVFWLGGLPGKATIASLKASQQTQLTAALESQAASKQAEIDRINKLLVSYVQTPVNPIALDIGTRVYKYAAASDCPVSSTPTASGAINPTPQPANPSSAGSGIIEQRLNDHFKACAQDAAQLAALQAAWPR